MLNSAALVVVRPVIFVRMRVYLTAPLHADETAPTAAGTSARPLKWTHKAPLLAALATLDVGAARSTGGGAAGLVRQVRKRVRKLDKSGDAASFLRARELAAVFPRALLALEADGGGDAAAPNRQQLAAATAIGDHFAHAAQLHQLLVTCRLIKHTALVSPDHAAVPELLALLQRLLDRTGSSLLGRTARRIEAWLAALPPLLTAPPLSSAELGAAVSRHSLDWRPLSGAALRVQGATAARLVLDDAQREWVVGLCDRTEHGIDSLNAFNTHKRFAAVVSFLQGKKTDASAADSDR